MITGKISLNGMTEGSIFLNGKPEYQRDDLILATEISIHNQVESIYNAVPQIIRSNRQHFMILNVKGEEVAKVEHDLYRIKYRIMHPESSNLTSEA